MQLSPKDTKDLLLVAIGDSVTSNFHIASWWWMLFQMWFGKKESWFHKIAERMKSYVPVVAFNFSSAGSRFVSRGASRIKDFLFHIESIEKQVNRVLRLKRFPDMIVLLAGHNELDWTKRNGSFQDIIAEFQTEYMSQLERLCKKAHKQKHPVSIVVFGLLNYRNIFDLRIVSKKAKQENPKRFPYYDHCYHKFASLLPENRDRTIELIDEIEKTIHALVEACKSKYRSSNFHISYSDVFSRPSVDSLEYVTESDAWHPSDAGQERLADEAWGIIREQMDFLSR